MLKKRGFTYFGFSISLIGIALITKNFSLTGFVISEAIDNVKLYFFPIILFIGGILISVSGDDLQAWLERKEKEHASPSLKDKLQIEEERKYFHRRYSGHIPWYRRLGKSRVEQIRQEEGKYVKSIPSHNNSSGKTFSWHSANIDNGSKEIPQLRKEVLMAKKQIDRLSESGEISDYYMAIQNYYGSAVKLKEALTKSKLDMPQKVESGYVEIGRERTNKAISRESRKLKEDVVENRVAFSHGNVSQISERHRILGKLKKHYAPNQEIPSMEELERLYLERGKTIPLSRFAKDNIFFHSFPLGQHTNLNTHRAEYNSKTSIKAFLDYINGEQPMLSVASMPSRGHENIMTRFAGIVIKEGKVYDASSGDMVSQANHGKKTRFRGMDEKGDAGFPIETRAESALRRGSYRQNEFIVGDYKIGGLYFDSDHLRSLSAGNGLKKEEIVPQMAREAIERSLSLYEVTKKGFKEVDPRKYIKNK